MAGVGSEIGIEVGKGAGTEGSGMATGDGGDVPQMIEVG